MKKLMFLLTSLLTLSICFSQFDEAFTWDEVLDDAVAVQLNGPDTIYYLDDSGAETGYAKTTQQGKNPLFDPDIVYSGAGSAGIYDNTFYINLSKNFENVNKGQFGVNVTGMFDQLTMPNDSTALDQWQWISNLTPKVLRFPSGENSKFMHLLNLGSNKGYGYDINEMIQFYDATDNVQNAPATDIILSATSSTGWESWMETNLKEQFFKLKEAYIDQERLDPGHKYIDDFIELVQKIQTEHPGHIVDVIVCLNILSESASECKNIVDYLRNNGVNVTGG